MKYEMISDDDCVFFQEKESMQYLMFEWETMKNIWVGVLKWLNSNH